MKIVVFLFFLTLYSYSQTNNYVKYYNLCNQATKYLSEKEFDKSLKKFDSAFALVKYQHVSNLLNASVAASLLQNKNAAIKYLKRAILNGASPSVLASKEFKVLEGHKLFTNLADCVLFFVGEYHRRINLKYSKEIDSLFYVDQVIIRNVKTPTPLYKIDVYVYASERQKYDSIQFQYLLTLIKKNGFPSEQRVGVKSYEGAKLVIHHSLRMPSNKEFMDMFKVSVMNGEYLPADFAWMYDQSRTNLNEKPYYYFNVGDASGLSLPEKKEINKRRNEIGLNALEDDKIIKPF